MLGKDWVGVELSWRRIRTEAGGSEERRGVLFLFLISADK